MMRVWNAATQQLLFETRQSPESHEENPSWFLVDWCEADEILFVARHGLEAWELSTGRLLTEMSSIGIEP